MEGLTERAANVPGAYAVEYRPMAEGEMVGSSMYGLIMGYIGSELGNRGEFDKADWYSEVRVREGLRSRRLASIAIGLYDRWWNYMERKRKGISADRILDGEEELTKCILFSSLSKRTLYESFFREKLEQEKWNRG